MTKNIILLDTDTYLEDEDYAEGLQDDLEYLLEEATVAPRGEVIGWILQSKRSSHYGNIAYNGAEGYRDLKTTDLTTGLLSAGADLEKIVFQDNSGKLEAVYYDHDGENYCSVHSIPKSKAAEYDNFQYKTHAKKLEFIKNLSAIKIKKSFLKSLENKADWVPIS